MHRRLANNLNRVIELKRQAGVLNEETIQGIEELHTLHLSTEDVDFGEWLNRKLPA